jgi:hypothetical protein
LAPVLSAMAPADHLCLVEHRPCRHRQQDQRAKDHAVREQQQQQQEQQEQRARSDDRGAAELVR